MPLPTTSSCPLGLSRVRLLACLRELPIKFAITNCSDQRIDHGRQLVERRNRDCGFAFGAVWLVVGIGGGLFRMIELFINKGVRADRGNE